MSGLILDELGFRGLGLLVLKIYLDLEQVDNSSMRTHSGPTVNWDEAD